MGRPLNPQFPAETAKERHQRELTAKRGNGFTATAKKLEAIGAALVAGASSPSDGALDFEAVPAPKKPAKKPAAKKKAAKR